MHVETIHLLRVGRGFSTGFTISQNPPKGTIIAYSTKSADCGASGCLGSNGFSY